MAEKYNPDYRKKQIIRGALYFSVFAWTVYPFAVTAIDKVSDVIGRVNDKRAEALQHPGANELPTKKVQVCRDLMTLVREPDNSFTVVLDPSINDDSAPNPQRHVQWYDTRDNALISEPQDCPVENRTGFSDGGLPTTDYLARPECRESRYLDWRRGGSYSFTVRGLDEQQADKVMTAHIAASAALRQDCAA